MCRPLRAFTIHSLLGSIAIVMLHMRSLCVEVHLPIGRVDWSIAGHPIQLISVFMIAFSDSIATEFCCLASVIYEPARGLPFLSEATFGLCALRYMHSVSISTGNRRTDGGRLLCCLLGHRSLKSIRYGMVLIITIALPMISVRLMGADIWRITLKRATACPLLALIVCRPLR